jgi:hypothetical protein
MLAFCRWLGALLPMTYYTEVVRGHAQGHWLHSHLAVRYDFGRLCIVAGPTRAPLSGARDHFTILRSSTAIE